MSLALVVH